MGVNFELTQTGKKQQNYLSLTIESNPYSEKILFLEQKNPKINFDLVFVQGNSLVGASCPNLFFAKTLGAISETDQNFAISLPEERKEIIEYTVEKGETLSSIAEKFNISVNTIIWANNLSPKSLLKPGDKIIILPISGVLHYVKSGETLTQIAKTYQANLSEIVSFNELINENDIRAGDFLVIPNGKKPPVYQSKREKSQNQVLGDQIIPLASSYFICPIAPPCTITQGLHWNNAIDFSNGKCGSPIYAAAQGQVLRVKYGYNYGAGNYLTILHPNGVITFYGHLQTILVQEGEVVNQGQIIALMGGKPGMPGAGRSTGCHLHFGVQGAKNPFAY